MYIHEHTDSTEMTRNTNQMVKGQLLYTVKVRVRSAATPVAKVRAMAAKTLFIAAGVTRKVGLTLTGEELEPTQVYFVSAPPFIC